MKNVLILLAIFVASFLTACAILEPDDGRHRTPPTVHWEPYQPKDQSSQPDFDLNQLDTPVQK